MSLWRELLCWLIGHDFFRVIYDEEQYPRRICERCGVWAEAKGWRRT